MQQDIGSREEKCYYLDFYAMCVIALLMRVKPIDSIGKIE
jgi:hypothetical protein